MQWFAHITRSNEFRYDLLIKFGCEGYYCYFRAIEILGEEDRFYEPKRASKEQLELQFYPLKWERLAEILTWIGTQEKAQFKFHKDGDKFYLHTEKLVELNREYIRKHPQLKKTDNGRTMDGQQTETFRPIIQDNTIHNKTKSKTTPDGVSLEIVKLFCKLRKELKPTLDDYMPKWSKEVILAKSIKHIPSEDIDTKMRLYLKKEDAFFTKRGYCFADFVSNINAFSVKKLSKSSFTPREE